MEIKKLYQHFLECNSVETDTRKDLTNCMYFALKGENFNGNEFALDALKNGANYSVVDEVIDTTDDRLILVDDVLKALQNLATHHRIELGMPIIALTGSNGKTTTKELINSVLSQKYSCTSTKGNLNNHIGVPLTLLSMTKETEVGVVEMGANHPNEIDALCKIALPNFGYITNFGKVHLEGFGSLEGVVQAKTEMYHHIKDHNEKVFVNLNDTVQDEKSSGMDRITFGNQDADCQIVFSSADPFVALLFEKQIIQSKLIGKYNYQNIAASIAIGNYFEVSVSKIKKAIENYIPSNNRSQIIEKDSKRIILDAYNANPNSMQAALQNLSQLTDSNKIAILGDMFEIGKDSIKEHQNISDLAEKLNINQIVLIGKMFAQINVNSEQTIQFESLDDFKQQLDVTKFNNTTILIKASRGMALERIVDLL